MAKRVYIETVKKWLIRAGITAGTLIGGLFIYLIFLGAIEITGYSGDVVCAGTIEDPCYAYINFTANEDIFIYPVGYDPWGRDTIIQFNPAVKSWKLQRSWGNGWRDIPLNKTCTGTWCGAPDNKGVSYSYVLREGKDYQFRIVGYKNDPYEDVKWSIGYEDKEYLDPTWKGIKKLKGEQSTLMQIRKEEYIRVTDQEGFDKNLNWSFEKINDTQWIATFKVKDEIYSSIKECQEMINIKDKELCAKNRANELFGKEKEVEYGDAIVQLEKYPKKELTENINVSKIVFDKTKGKGEYILNFPDGFKDGEKIKIGINSTTIMTSSTDPIIGWTSSSRYQYSCRGENSRIHVIFQYPAEAIYYVYSDDNGYTWTNPVNFTSATDLYDMNLDCYDENITVAYSDQSGTDRMIVNFSNDNGETWSGMPPVSNTNVWMPHCMQRGGELVCAYGENSGDEYDFCYSRNMSGWENCQVIWDNSGAQAFLVDMVYYPDEWYTEEERGVFLKMGDGNYHRLFRGNYTNTTLVLSDAGVDSWTYIGDPDRPGVFYIVMDADSSTNGRFLYSMDNSSSFTDLGIFDSSCGNGVGQIRDEAGGDRAYVEVHCWDYTTEVIYSFTWSGSGADPTDKTLRYNGTAIEPLIAANIDGRNSNNYVDMIYADLISGDYNVFWLSYHFNDSIYPEFYDYWDDSYNLTTSGTGYFNVSVNNTNGTVIMHINNTDVTATNLSGNVFNVSYDFTVFGTYPYYWKSWGTGPNVNYQQSDSRNYIVNSNYTMYILDPTTGDPESVTYPQNITVTFLFDKDGANVTSGVSLHNITIGGVQADVLESGVESSLEQIDYEDMEGYSEGTSPDPIGNWTQAAFDTDDWLVYTGNGESSSTGPTSDYDGYYAMVETSSGQCNNPDTAVLYRSPAIDFDSYTSINVTFARHMYGSTMGTLRVRENSTGDWIDGWNMTGNQGDEWVVENVSFTGKSGVGTIAIWMDCGASYTSDAAIDSVNITGFGATTQQFEWIDGTGWQVNVTIPSLGDGTYDLFINASYGSFIETDTETNSVVIGTPSPSHLEWSQNQTNSTLAGENVLFSVFWNSSDNLSSYIFGWHNGENWTETNYSGDQEAGEQTFYGEGGSGESLSEYYTFASDLENWTAATISGTGCTPIWDDDGTPSSGTGPCNGVSNCGTDDAGYDDNTYVFVEMSGSVCGAGEIGAITSTNAYDWDSYTGEQISFWYHRLGASLGSYQRLQENSTGSWVNLWGITTAASADVWYENVTDLSSLTGTGHLRFTIEGNSQWSNDMSYDAINITSDAGAGITEDENKTAVDYLNVFSGDIYDDLDNITITTYISYYNTSGSIENGNSNITLWLEVYNGTEWIDEGDMGPGATQTTGNYSVTITTPSILSAWQTDANRDIRISARLVDYADASNFDTINWTGVWVNMESHQEFLNDSAVSFTDGMCSTPKTLCWSNITKEITSSIGATVKWYVWANNTDSDTNITSIFQFITTSGAADTCTCPGSGSNWEVDMEDTCTLSTPCNLGTGNLSWIGSSGSFTCNAQLNLTNRNAPPGNTIFYWSSGCEINRE